MPKKPPRSNITTAAEQLRAVIWSKQEGELLGSEDDLTALLQVSRPTVRQVARLLEQEGLLQVKRGIGGGYFACRPSVEIIENSVSSYLKTVQLNVEDVTEIASAVWIFAVRKLAVAGASETPGALELVRAKVAALTEEATFIEVSALERECRRQVFKIIDSAYIELIFHINTTFSQQHLDLRPADQDGTEGHMAFVRAWRKAKLLEIDSLCDGDVALAEMAAKRSRNLFHKRLWGGE